MMSGAWVPILGVLSIVFFIWTARGFSAGPFVIRLSGRTREVDDKEVRRVLLWQFKASFWLVLSSGVISVLLIAGVFMLVFLTGNAGWVQKSVGMVCGLGDSALFAYFVRVWRRAGAMLGLRSEMPQSRERSRRSAEFKKSQDLATSTRTAVSRNEGLDVPIRVEGQD
jgi:hypothetical protein